MFIFLLMNTERMQNFYQVLRSNLFLAQSLINYPQKLLFIKAVEISFSLTEMNNSRAEIRQS